MRTSENVRVGQVWEDTSITTAKARWLVRVMRLNQKSARVEPIDEHYWNLAGYDYQYRMEFRHFDNGRMRLVQETR